jgi:hypothetical protein
VFVSISAANHPSPVPPGFDSDADPSGCSSLPRSRSALAAESSVGGVIANVGASLPVSPSGGPPSTRQTTPSLNEYRQTGRQVDKDEMSPLVADLRHRGVDDVERREEDGSGGGGGDSSSQRPSVGSASAAAAPRRRAVDLSDLRHCAIVQTHLKAGTTTTGSWRTYGCVRLRLFSSYCCR